jgi:4-amino-4-deoxy-L-arabinose transferase-like glycosyltransferase
MGLVATLLGVGTLVLGGYHAARRVFRLEPGLSAILGGVVLAWTWLTLGMIGLGLAGWLTSWALLAWSAAGLLTSAVVSRSTSPYSLPGEIPLNPSPLVGGGRGGGSSLRPTPDPPPYPPPQGGRERAWNTPAQKGLGLAAILALGFTLWASIVMFAPSLFYPVKVISDGPIYHLYFAVKWWKAGRIFLVPTPFGESAAPYFPAVGDLWLTWLVVLGKGDRLARVGQAPFAFLAVATVYAIARRLGARTPAALIASAWFATVMPFFVLSFEPNVDSIFVAGYVLAVYFGLRYLLRDSGVGSLFLGGLAAGAAWGTKAPGVVIVPPLLLLGVGMVLARAGSWRTRLRDVAVILVVPFILEGFWLAQNAWLTGNPLYPLHLEAFGRTWLAGWFGPEAMKTSPYYIPRGDWRAGVDIVLSFLDPRLTPVWLVALFGGWRIGRTRRAEDAAVWWCWLLVILNALLYWMVIPYRTQVRFLIPAAALATIPLARLFDRNRLWLWTGVLLLTAHILTPQHFPFPLINNQPPWDFCPYIPNNAPGPVQFLGDIGALLLPRLGVDPVWVGCRLLVGVACLGIAGLFAWARRGHWIRSIVPTAGVALLVWAQAVLIDPGSRVEILYRFPPFTDYLAGWSDLDRRTRGSGARIAYAGTNLPYYLMGNDFRNEVYYINIDSHRGWLLHDYHRAAASLGLPATWPDTRPGWDRVRPDYDAWLANLRAEGIQFLVVARANPQEGRHNVADTENFPIERVWAEAHPEVFVLLYSDPLFKTYGLRKLEKKS